MTLQELIKALEDAPQKRVCAVGFGEPMSYRGYYERVAFPPESNVTVGRMLRNAQSALGQTFEGYKGGNFTMRPGTLVHIAYYGCTDGKQDCDEGLTMAELQAMLESKP